MAWGLLIVAGLFEIGWPIGLKYGWTDRGLQPWPLAASAACLTVSGICLLAAQRTIPMGTAYAVWTGIGAAGTFLVGILVFAEPATAARFLCVGMITAGVAGLKFFGE